MEDALVLVQDEATYKASNTVLILVLMEDALVRTRLCLWGLIFLKVLILVLMEDALVRLVTTALLHVHSVLILVLMEDALVQQNYSNA